MFLASRNRKVHRSSDDRPRRKAAQVLFGRVDQPLDDQGDELREGALPSTDCGPGEGGIAEVGLQRLEKSALVRRLPVSLYSERTREDALLPADRFRVEVEDRPECFRRTG